MVQREDNTIGEANIATEKRYDYWVYIEPKDVAASSQTSKHHAMPRNTTCYTHSPIL